MILLPRRQYIINFNVENLVAFFDTQNVFAVSSHLIALTIPFFALFRFLTSGQTSKVIHIVQKLSKLPSRVPVLTHLAWTTTQSTHEQYSRFNNLRSHHQVGCSVNFTSS